MFLSVNDKSNTISLQPERILIVAHEFERESTNRDDVVTARRLPEFAEWELDICMTGNCNCPKVSA